MNAAATRRALLILADSIEHAPAAATAALQPLILAAQDVTLAALEAKARLKRARALKRPRRQVASTAELERLIDAQRARIARANRQIAKRQRAPKSRRP